VSETVRLPEAPLGSTDFGADLFAGPAEATDLAGVHVLKHANLFMLSDDAGDIVGRRHGLGLYDGDTRMLSTYILRVDDDRPGVLLPPPGAAARATIWLTNPDRAALPRQTMGIERERAIHEGFTERITLRNYSQAEVTVRLTLQLGSDFADVFEVRGVRRRQRGERLPLERDGDRMTFGYRGIDERTYRTHVRLAPEWAVIDGRDVNPLLGLDLQIAPAGASVLEVEIWTEIDGSNPGRGDGPIRSSAAAAATVDAAYAEWRSGSARVETSHGATTRALETGLGDLHLLLNSGPDEGERYLGAGVPWYSCLFGRDSIIASMQLLPITTALARETLLVLARRQAATSDEWRDAQPGKILHELRTGELALANEIPHTPYYGTIDATPLWLMLLNQYQRWTGDDALVEQLWPNALAALAWIDDYGDVDGDGFVEYRRVSERGLDNQGWKDSWDAVRNRDGSLAAPPIALVEVQAYVFAARRGIARLAARRGEAALATEQEAAAERLRKRFEEAFWMADAGTYAFALDGAKRQVDAIASNAGHALWAGICSAERAASVAAVLTGDSMWSGWGIRTLSAAAGGYNPIGYHTGSIWPHDNAIAAAGFARYGLVNEAALVAGGLLEAGSNFAESRLPELFSGFGRDEAPRPVPYPVACSPQAWAAGAIFQVVGTMLGLQPDANERRLELRPALPEWLPDLSVTNLRVGDATVNLAVSRADDRFDVEVTPGEGELEVIVRD
jgi:glycogen debranching enzyme